MPKGFSRDKVYEEGLRILAPSWREMGDTLLLPLPDLTGEGVEEKAELLPPSGGDEGAAAGCGILGARGCREEGAGSLLLREEPLWCGDGGLPTGGGGVARVTGRGEVAEFMVARGLR